MGSTLSDKWVAQVLRDRGIPVPGLLDIKNTLAGFSDIELIALKASLMKIQSGVDDAVAVQSVLSRLSPKQIRQEPDPVSAQLVVESAGPIRIRAKHHIYGLKSALTIELDTLRAKDKEEAPRYTVLVEAARSDGVGHFDWERKIPFQLMLRELPLVACALLGKLERSLTLNNHGPESNKTLVLEDQGGKILVQISYGAKKLLVPVTASDVFAWADLVFLALKMNSPHLADSVLISMLNRAAALHNKSNVVQ